MSEDPKPTSAKPRMSDYLANERTFLAWMRTSLALVGLGFALAKFDVWLRRLGGEAGKAAPSDGWGAPMGLFMIAAGAVLALLAAAQFHLTNRRIARDDSRPNTALAFAALALIVGLSAVVFVYVLTRQTGS